MSFDVYPLAITMGDLPMLQRICNEVLGFSPTRALDKTYLNVTDPAAFLACLDLEDKPLEALREGKRRSGIYSHFFASLIAVVPNDVVSQVVNLGRLAIYSKEAKRESVVIMSGTMDNWYDAILSGCTKSVSYDVRAVMTGALACFEKVGLREVFAELVHKTMLDGTIELCQR